MPSSSFNWGNCLKYATATDVGMRRATNQDSHIEMIAPDPAEWYRSGHLFVVADGMGAHVAGELASKIAIDQVALLYEKQLQKSPPEALLAAIRGANAEIHRRGQANVEFHNMGTTISSLLVLPQGAILGHVGDSRVYQLRKSNLRQLTFDHSLVWEMRASGQMSDQAEVLNAIPKNVITRSLGPHPDVQVDLEGPYPLQVGDKFLLCSDGLTGKVSDEEIGGILFNLDPQPAAEFLICLANLRGGPDNITVTIVEAVRPELATQLAQVNPLVVGDEDRPTHPVPGWLWASSQTSSRCCGS